MGEIRMRTYLLATTALLVIASPAYADRIKAHIRDRSDDSRAVEKAQERLDVDLSDRRRERIEEAITKIEEKFDLGGVIDPPPPDPEQPVELFKDEFSRDTTEVGNGWTGSDGSIQDQHLRLTNDGDMRKAVPLDGQQYTSITVSWDMVPEPDREGAVAGQDVQMYWQQGGPGSPEETGITTEMHEFPDHRSYSYTTPIKSEDITPEPYYTSFDFGFRTNGTSTATIDNVTVTGILYEPPATGFVGF
jgi:hypothetical protein